MRKLQRKIENIFGHIQLVEILVVAAIVGLLACMMIPVLAKAKRQALRKAQTECPTCHRSFVK